MKNPYTFDCNLQNGVNVYAELNGTTVIAKEENLVIDLLFCEEPYKHIKFAFWGNKVDERNLISVTYYSKEHAEPIDIIGNNVYYLFEQYKDFLLEK